MLSISDKAAVKLKDMLTAEQKPLDQFGLRLGVKAGGCSGLSYVMAFDATRDGDHAFEKDGVRVFVDPKSMPHITGTTLDYVEALTGAGFVLHNPNVKGSCGCGKSFTV